ncbi:MAG: hypothetical protein K2Q97_06875 [Burkholderiaceae bacterium]|nr:hypothetical protein [Burkholderiaceae bacterium]
MLDGSEPNTARFVLNYAEGVVIKWEDQQKIEALLAEHKAAQEAEKDALRTRLDKDYTLPIMSLLDEIKELDSDAASWALDAPTHS